MRLLLVEDDKLLGDGIQAGLNQAGYAVDWLENAQSAEAALRTEKYELMILDLGLPDRCGLEILKRLRNRHFSAQNSGLPVLILTARDTVSDRITGLDSGADDYMIKPFDLDELNARIRALTRRHHGRANPVITHDKLTLDPAAHTVTLDGQAIKLSRREFAILQLLLESCGRVLSRRQLEEGLYSWGEEVESNAVEVYIHHLRKKLGSGLIRTLRGVGYIIDKPT
ncbi:MAG TPA: response regulator [Gammaproteobacteria bacterium]|nr:response regulator [Gammaproteobacteria bacterium]